MRVIVKLILVLCQPQRVSRDQIFGDSGDILLLDRFITVLIEIVVDDLCQHLFSVIGGQILTQ